MSRAATSPVPLDEARSCLSRFGLQPGRGVVPLSDAAGHVLSADVRADRDLPPFDRAMVDGYAIRLNGAWIEGSEFEVLGVLAAGSIWRGTLRPGQALQVMTGAPVPRGADGVVMVERSERLSEDRVRLFGPFAPAPPPDERPRPGIAPRGEDAGRGSVVLPRGVLLDAAHVAVLAAVGLTAVAVYKKPSLELLATGAEVVPADSTPAHGQIRDSNAPYLRALLSRSDLARVRRAAIVHDDFRSLCRAIRRNQEAVLVLTGGVSAGQYDLVPDALEECGYRIHLHGVAIRPGRPFLFATSGSGAARRAVFGLPGNPVSVQVTAWEFLLPYLRAAAGWAEPAPRRARARAAQPIERKPGLAHFVLGEWSLDPGGDPSVREVRSNGSGDFLSAARANCLIPLPAEAPRVAAGEECWIHPWGIRP